MLTFGYDGLDHLTSETTPRGSVSYDYDDAGRQTSITVGGQSAVSYSYDSADRLTAITQGTTATTLSYDDANRVTSVTLPNGVMMSYGYDVASQLTSIDYTFGAVTLGDLSYGYDLVGRRASVDGSFARTGLPDALGSATYDAANQINRWDGTRFTYDDNGNLTSDGTNSYSWDTRNQLAAISGASSASFSYDIFGRRTEATVGGATTGYHYDGRNIVQELDGSGTPTADWLSGLGIDSFISRSDTNGRRNRLTDALGSTVALVDDAGTIQTEYTYDPFGRTTASGAPDSNPIQYTGREHDGTGLYYYRARYYDPALGRFVSEDPIGFAGGQLNLHAYVGNSPINFTDPIGLCGWGEPWECGHEAAGWGKNTVIDLYGPPYTTTKGLQIADTVPITETCVTIAVATGGGGAAAIPGCEAAEVAIGTGAFIASEIQIWGSDCDTGRKHSANELNLINFIADVPSPFIFEEAFEVGMYGVSNEILKCSPSGRKD